MGAREQVLRSSAEPVRSRDDALLRGDDGAWRRDDERHDIVLIDSSYVPELLREYGVDATLSASFGDEQQPAGLVTIIGRRSR